MQWETAALVGFLMCMSWGGVGDYAVHIFAHICRYFSMVPEGKVKED